MGWLLDTNAWILHLKNPGGPIEQRLNRLQPSDVFLCSVVKAELWHGAHKYGNFERRRNALGNMFAPFVSLPFDDAAAQCYGGIRHGLEIRGRMAEDGGRRGRASRRRWISRWKMMSGYAENLRMSSQSLLSEIESAPE